METFHKVQVSTFKACLSTLLILFHMFNFTTTGVPIPPPDLPDNCNSEEHCCMPRPYTGKPVRQFEHDPTLPLRVRRPAHLLEEDAIMKLEKAYKLQRALPATDPRSLINQANLHCMYCDNGIFYPNMSWPLEIHSGWLFLPWHRMFLYFHERILGKLLDDETFALPYWNWDNQSLEEPTANTLPYIYATNKSSSLWNQNRNKCAQPPSIVNLNSAGGCTDETPEKLRTENTRIMYTQVVSGAPTSRLFFGMPYVYGDAGGYGPGTLEDNPHGPVHLWLGDPNAPTPFDDMGNFGRSSRDPMFYTHHANVDRIWTIWKTLPGEQRTEPTHRDFLDAKFTFYDENGDLVIVNVSQSIKTNLLRYEYEASSTGWITNGQQSGDENRIPVCNPTNPSQTNAMLVTTPELTPQDILHLQPLTFRVPRLARRNPTGEEVLEIAGIKLDNTLQTHWVAFLFFPSADARTSVACSEFVGTFNFAPHVGQAQMSRERVWRVALRHKLEAIGKQNCSDVVVTLAQFGPSLQPVRFSHARVFYDASPNEMGA